MITRVHVLLIASFLIGAVMTGRIAQHNRMIWDWSNRLPSMVPPQDPRSLAAAKNIEVVGWKRKLNGQLTEARRMFPATYHSSPLSIAQPKPTPEPNVSLIRPAISGKQDRAEVSKLLGSRLGIMEIRRVERIMDPSQGKLPRSVTLDFLAGEEWLRLRSRWPNPVSKSEMGFYLPNLGITTELLKILDPNDPQQLAAIERAQQQKKIDASYVLAWMKNKHRVRQSQKIPTHLRGYPRQLTAADVLRSNSDTEAVQTASN